MKHFSGHEVAEIMQSEGAKPGGDEVPLERLGDPVRFPRHAVVGCEHESVTINAASATVAIAGEDLRGGLVEFDCMSAFGLGLSEHGSGWAFHPAVRECHLSKLQIDVPPSKSEQLGAAGAGSRCEHHEHVELGLADAQVLKEDDEFLG